MPKFRVLGEKPMMYWVELEAKGKSHVIKSQPVLPTWATPEGFDAIMEKRKTA